MNEFIYTLDNLGIYAMKRRILSGGKPGIYLLSGKSGSGKSTFLREMARKADMKFISCQHIVESIGWELKQDMRKETPRAGIIVVENLEELLGRTATTKEVNLLFERWVSQGRMVIGTTNIEEITDGFESAHIINVKKVKVNKFVVKKVAKMAELELVNKRLIREISNSRDISDVKNRIYTLNVEKSI